VQWPWRKEASPAAPDGGPTDLDDEVARSWDDKEWFRRNSRRNHIFYGSLLVVTIAGGILATVLLTTGAPKWVAAIASGAAALAAGISTGFGLQESHLRNSTTQRALERELRECRARVGNYEGLTLDEAKRELATRSEEIKADANALWNVTTRRTASGPGGEPEA
jgi:hypothetical protein